MNDQFRKRFARLIRIGLVWLGIVLFASAYIAEPSHFHAGPGTQNCSLCIAAHSVARPVNLISPIASPARCLALLVVARSLLPDEQIVVRLYIRPPPLL